jgi:membrane-bound lytic murein transglycosylase D
MKIKVLKSLEFIFKFALSIVMILLIGIVWKYIVFAKTDLTTTDNEYRKEFNENYSIYAVPLPDKLVFAGEEVPLEYYDVFESLDREFLVNTYWQSQTMLFIKRANKYFPIIERILKKNGVPEDFKYLALAESGLTNAISPSGAKGYWQLLEATAKKYGLRVNDYVDERYNLEKSTEAACKYLKDAYKIFDNWTLAAASYNVGMSALQRSMEKQGETSYYNLHLNRETARYVYRILAIKYILENPEKFGFHFRKKDLYKFPAYKVVRVDTSIQDLAVFAHQMGTNLKVLKDLNPWLISDKLIITDSIGYEIKIPKSRLFIAENKTKNQINTFTDTSTTKKTEEFTSPDSLSLPKDTLLMN